MEWIFSLYSRREPFQGTVQWGSISARCRYWSRMLACCVFNNSNFLNMMMKDLAFIRNRCCHLTICLHMMEPHIRQNDDEGPFGTVGSVLTSRPAAPGSIRGAPKLLQKLNFERSKVWTSSNPQKCQVICRRPI